MAQVHEFNISNVHLTGGTAPVPQRRFTLNIKWTDNNGQNQEHTGTYTFPNVLSNAPDGYLRGKALEMIQELAYAALGIHNLPE